MTGTSKNQRVEHNLKCFALLDEYEREIEMLENKVYKTEEENEYLQKLRLRERKLRRLVS